MEHTPESSSFYSMILRMKYVGRWGLMRNTWQENLSEHSLEVAILAHALAVIASRRFGREADPHRAAVLALFHDAPEIITGDLPTPVKYYNDEICHAYKQIEQAAGRTLLELLPEDLRDAYEPLFVPQEEDAFLWRLVKAADKLSALIKCMEEEKAGNTEFSVARQAQLEALHAMALPEAELFLSEFLDGFSKTLDEQSHPQKEIENPPDL